MLDAGLEPAIFALSEQRLTNWANRAGERPAFLISSNSQHRAAIFVKSQ